MSILRFGDFKFSAIHTLNILNGCECGRVKTENCTSFDLILFDMIIKFDKAK